MQAFRVAGAALGGIAVVCLAIAQFTPWGGIDSSFSDFSADVDAYVWQVEYNVAGFGEREHDSRGWYDNDFDGEDGSGQVRTAAPFLAVGLGLTLIGAVLHVLVRKPLGSIVTFFAVLVGAVGVLVFSLGVDDIFDGEQKWGPAFYLAIVGTSLALIGAVVGALPEHLAPKFKSKGGPSF